MMKMKMKSPKHKMKMPKHKMPLPSKFDHSFSNKQHQPQFCSKNKLKLHVIHGHHESPSVSLLSTEEEEEEEEDEEDDTHPFSGPDFCLPVASCRELLLTVRGEYDDDEELALWNPSTKVKRALPRPLRPPPSVEYEWENGFYGLGLDPKSNDDDYKVLRFVSFKYGDDGFETAAGFMGYEVVELFSLKTDSWKRIPYPHADFAASPLLEDPIYINGFNYWTAGIGRFNACPGNGDLFFISFDFAKEIFPSALIPGPPNKAYKFDDPDKRYHLLLAEYQGSLALVVTDKHEKQLELWVWSSRGVWTVGVDVFNPLAFLKDRLFYFEDSVGELVLFDCATQKLRKKGVCAVRPRHLIMYPCLTRTT